MNEQVKPMTKRELIIEIMRIIQETRGKVSYAGSFKDDLESFNKALRKIEDVCRLEASREMH